MRARAWAAVVLSAGLAGAAAFAVGGPSGGPEGSSVHTAARTAASVPSPASLAAEPRLTTPVIAPPQDVPEGPPYNGRYTFIRLRYGESGSDLRGFSFDGRRSRGGWGRGGGAPWSHDYPRAETNFAKILEATTLIDTYTEGSSGRVLTLADPALFQYPIASIIEVGYWQPSDQEILNLRNWLLKGGFLIVDDTRQERGFEYQNFAGHMRRALPEYEILPVPEDHEIYDAFFRIDDRDALLPPYGRNVPVYLGIFQDNDPVEGRLMVMINFNTDLQEYWEFSDVGYYPIDLSNDAYKFGVNYLVYAFTH